ncbi:MAG: MazG nucleotide pyrophosphohydrolase domain-containing protein [Actinoplanes sp.]
MSLTIAQLQAAAWANKRAKGFNTTDVSLEFNLLTAEVGEAIDAWRRNPDGLAGELADVLIFLAGLAQMTGVDLERAVAEKLDENVGRVYVRSDLTGQLVKGSAK